MLSTCCWPAKSQKKHAFAEASKRIWHTSSVLFVVKTCPVHASAQQQQQHGVQHEPVALLVLTPRSGRNVLKKGDLPQRVHEQRREYRACWSGLRHDRHDTCAEWSACINLNILVTSKNMLTSCRDHQQIILEDVVQSRRNKKFTLWQDVVKHIYIVNLTMVTRGVGREVPQKRLWCPRVLDMVPCLNVSRQQFTQNCVLAS